MPGLIAGIGKTGANATAEIAFFSLDGPLDAIPNERQMRAANFLGFNAFVRNLGGDARRILERHGMDPGVISDPDRYIECQSLVDVFEYCSAALDEPLFGLKLAQFQEPEVYGCVTALCRAASTVREGVESLIGGIRIAHSPMAMNELVEGAETTELRWETRENLGANDQANLQAFVLNTKLLRLLGGQAFRPSYVNSTADMRSKDIPEIEARLGCKFYDRAPNNAIAFPTRLLDQPVASANRLVFRLLSGYLDRVKAASRKTIVEQVEDYVRGALPSGQCSIERCAKKLGTSVRTLQSNLSANGLKFSDILERRRIGLAKTYLHQGDTSLDEVAAMLGYSEQSSFGRAFKRWTGSTPQRYRTRYQA